MPVLAAAAVLAAITWGYLLAGHGGYWLTSHRLPQSPRSGSREATRAGGGRGSGRADGAGPARPGLDVAGLDAGPARWPAVVAVVPARDEADVLPLTLPSLLAQDYPGEFSVVLVDDQSRDETAAVAVALAQDQARRAIPAGASRASGAPASRLRVVAGQPLPPGWAGKVWAMAQGVGAAGGSDFLLFTDADIAWAPGALTALVEAAQAGHYDLVSQMALLRADTLWERLIVPAFVYFFAQLYPFRRASRPGARTAAAAGGCMLARRSALAAAGGLAGIRAARIDDVALARLLKRSAPPARCWLGFGTQVRSLRPYPSLASLWDMIARSAYTQLRHSPALLALVLAGLAWVYALPPAAAIGGLAAAASGAGEAGRWTALAGVAGWAAMTATYLPVLRMYRLPAWRAATLPLVALLYGVITADSARRYHVGRGGEWKGRTSAHDTAG